VDGPALRWRSGRSGAMAVVGLTFLAIAFLVPASFARIGTPKLDVRREAERLEEQLQVLKEEKVLDKQRAHELKEKLEQLRKDALARDPVKTLEALDFLQDTTHKSAQEAAEAAARKIEEMAKAGALAEALEKNGNKLDAAQMKEAMNQLAGLMKKAEAENALAEAGLDQEILDKIKEGKPLTKEEMKKLADALKGAKGELAKTVSNSSRPSSSMPTLWASATSAPSVTVPPSPRISRRTAAARRPTCCWRARARTARAAWTAARATPSSSSATSRRTRASRSRTRRCRRPT
jgi:hypothetical protein